MASNQHLGVSLEQLLTLLKRKGIPLPFEIGTFVALEACEALGNRWGVLRVGEVWLADDGQVAVAPETTARSEEGAARAVVTLLADLLVAAAPGVPAMLLGLIERGPSGGEWTLSNLRDDLEASLVPLNRGATKRVLARLLREAKREGDRPSLRPATSAPSQHQMDDELDALLGGGGSSSSPAPAPSSHSRFESVRPPRAREDHTEQVFDDEVSAVTLPRVPKLSSSLAEELEPEAEEPADDDELDAEREVDRDETATHRARRSAASDKRRDGALRPRLDAPIDLPDAPERESRMGLVVGAALLALTAGIGGMYFALGKDKIRQMLGASPAAPVVTPLKAPEKPDAPQYGDLVVTSLPDRAQVFLFAGRGPAVVEKLPVGVAHELLAIADGRAPTRAVVPADAAWEDTPEGPRYELAMQTGEDAVAPEQWDFGPTRLPATAGTPSAERGNVRVVTSPPGARVYQLIGFTPNARIDNLQLTDSFEVLVYLPGHTVERISVDRSMFQDLSGKLVAQLDVTLKPVAKAKKR